MKDIKAIRLHYSGEENLVFPDIPDDLNFCKVEHLSDKQQTWMTMFPNNKELEQNLNSLSSRCLKLIDITIVIISDIRFVSEVPTCELSYFKETYSESFTNLYIKHISRDGELLRIFKVNEFKGLKLETTVLHFKSIIGYSDLLILEVEDRDLVELINLPLGCPITSAGHWTIPTHDDETIKQYKDRLNQLLKYT